MPAAVSAGCSPRADTTTDSRGERVRHMFGRIASRYDLANRLMSAGVDRRWRRRAVDGLIPPPPHARGHRPRVLDLCAGTLDSSLAIHQRYPDADVIAGDFSAGMLAEGRRKLQGAARERIETMRLDAHDIPLSTASVDAIFCAFGTRNLSDLCAATREQARCLRPGGLLTVLELFRPVGSFARAFHAVYCRAVLPLVGWAATGDLDAYLYLPRSIADFEDAHGYGGLLQETGFADIRTQRLTLGIAGIVRAIRKADVA